MGPKLMMPSFFGDSFRDRQSTIGNGSRPELDEDSMSSVSETPTSSPRAGLPKSKSTKDTTTVELHSGGVNTRALKQGFLSKTSRHMKVWRTRFFVLETDLLIYYTSDREAHAVPRQKPKGHIPLHGSVTQRAADPLGFKLKTPQRVYAFKAETAALCEDWLKALSEFAPLAGGVATRESDGDSIAGSSDAGSRTVTLENVGGGVPDAPPADSRNTQTWTDVTPSLDKHPSQQIHYS